MTDSVHEMRTAAAAGDFLELWLADQAAGRTRSLPEYLARFPGFEDRIAREYLELRAPTPAPATAPATPPDPDGSIGPYRTIRLLGQGGQGTVWLAEDHRLGRQVALKVLAGAASALTAAQVERLRREGQALARLDHPGICAIYEAHLDGPQPWLAMRYVDGETVATLLARGAQESGGRAAASDRERHAAWLLFFARAADAVHAAHEVGILHRDLKPANLMRTHDGRPVVLDFGLARDLEATTIALTQAGELFGTLAYMAPEVLLGQRADRRADVYALGVTLYEALAGRRPFTGASHEALRRAIESGEATALTEVVPGVPRPLATVVATAIERDPDRRYATAQAFADDLRRVLAGEPIAARPLSTIVRVRRAITRHPVLATAAGLLLAGLLATLILLAQVERGRARLSALRQAYQALAMADDQPGQALHTVTEAALDEPHPEINDILYRVLDRCWEEHAIEAPRAPQATFSAWIAIDPDDRHLVYSDGNGCARIVDLATGKIARTVQHAAAGPVTAAFAGSDRVLTGGIDGCVRLSAIATGECLRAWTLHQPCATDIVPIPQIVVAPDGRRAASCGADGVIAVFPLDADGPVVNCRGHQGGIVQIAFDARGERLVSSGGHGPNTVAGDRTVRIFDARSGQELAQWGPFPGTTRWAAWSHDGTRIVVAHDENTASICQVDRRVPIAAFVHQGAVHWAEFTPDDQQLVTGSSDGLSVFEVATQARLGRHQDFHDRSVYRGTFSCDGRRLAVIAWDESARIYDTATWQTIRIFRGVFTRALGLCWDHAGKRIATVGWGMQTWYAAERPFLAALRGHQDSAASAVLSADGRRALSASADGDARIWDTKSGTSLETLANGSALRGARWSADERTVLVIGETAAAAVFGPDRVRRELGPARASDGWFFGTDRIVLAGADGAVRVHDAASGQLLQQHGGHRDAIECAAFHPGRPWLATGARDRTIRIVDLESGQLVHATEPWPPGALGPSQRVFALAFDPGGARLLASCEDQQVRVLTLGAPWTCTAIPIVPTPGRLLFVDGRAAGDRPAADQLIVVGNQWSGIVRTVVASDLSTVARPPGQHANLLVSLELQPHGRLALSASKDGTVRLFDATTTELRSVIRAANCPLRDAHFSADGAEIITAAADGEIRIWPVDPLAVALRHRPARRGDAAASR